MNHGLSKSESRAYAPAFLYAAVVLSVLAIFPFTPNVAQPIKLFLATLCVTMALLALFYRSLFSNRLTAGIKGPLGTIILLYLVLHVLAAAFSEFPVNSLMELQLLVVCALAFFASKYAIQDIRHFQNFLVAACLAMGLSSLYAFAQKAGIDPFPWADRSADEYRELPATFGNGNLAAHMLALCVVFAIYLASERRYRWALVLLPVYFLHLYWTRQRGAWVGFGGALALLGIFLMVGKKVVSPYRRTVFTLLSWSAVGVVLAVIVGALCRLLTKIPFPLDHALMLRYSGFASGAEMIRQKPILGWGAGNYPLFNPLYWTEYEQEYFAVKNSMNYHVHNEWLQSAIDAGVPAAGLFLLLFLAGIALGLLTASKSTEPHRRKIALLIAASLCTVLLDGMVGFNLHVVPVGLTVFVLLGVLETLYSEEPKVCSATQVRFTVGLLAGVALLVFVLGFRVFYSQILLKDGEVALHQRNAFQAERVLGRGERLAPWNWEFPNLRGHVALSVENPDAAIFHLERAWARNPNCIPLLSALGHAHLMRVQQTGITEETAASAKEDIHAMRTFADRILEICPLHHSGAALRATAALLELNVPGAVMDETQRQTLLQQAYDDMMTALHFAPGRTAPNYVTLALIHQALGQTNKAQHALRMACRLESDNADAWNAFETFAYKENRLRVFEATLTDAIKTLQGKDDADSAAALARLLVAQARLYERVTKDIGRAEQSFQEAVKADPTSATVWDSYSRFARQNQRMASFQSTLHEAYSNLPPEKSEEQRILGAVDTMIAKGPDAIAPAAEKLEQSMIEQQRRAAYQGTRMPLLAWATQFVVEEYELQKASITPSGDTLMRLAVVLGEAGDTRNALRLVDRALPMLPDADRGRAFYIRQKFLERLKPRS